MLYIIIIAIVLALMFSLYNYKRVEKLDGGSETMQEISSAIRIGASTFIKNEYKLVAIISAIITVILILVTSVSTAIAFLLGATMSGTAGYVGMKIATITNSRVAQEANTSRSLGSTLKVAFRGGSVMGLSVAAFALLGMLIVYVVFGKMLGQLDIDNINFHTNFLGIADIPFTMTVSGYALGCSVIAMFNRVGGGIYTKAADMGADLVGKTEAGIPEDDPRNPATIADNVGDNVGDVAGLGSDLLESFVGSMVSAIILASYIFYHNTRMGVAISYELLQSLIIFPILFASIGLIGSIVGIGYLLFKKVSDNPHKELNRSIQAAAFLTLVSTGFLSYYTFAGQDVTPLGFKLGPLSPWIASITGIISGIVIGHLAERYTSYDFKPTKKISAASQEGTALTITQGLATGMTSVFFPVVVLALATIVSFSVSGLYGVSMAALGMLSFVAATVSVDTYGPIADNAGGIAEMSKLDGEVREITDKLDSVGNTTAAVGKGFAIGSAAFAALSLFSSYLYAKAGASIDESFELVLNMIDSFTLAGGLVGAALPFLFSGILIEAVAKAARSMVDEVRRQFKEMPGILTGEEKPDYTRCIEISTKGSLREMVLPALVAVLVPIVSGLLFGPQFVGGLLIGTTLSAIMLALFTANSGGAWDNAKKYIEQGHFGGKGSDSHIAGVVGDTVGDPLKDTVGPSLDILIKIMAVIAVITVSIFSEFNLLSLLGLN